MISDPTLFVECDHCKERIEFDFAFVLSSPVWQRSSRFDGWVIDWAGTQGDALCPDCKDAELR